MKKGELYVFKDYSGLYKKVEFYRQSIGIDNDENASAVEFVIMSPARERYNRDSVRFEYFCENSRQLSRDTHCWSCKHQIDEVSYEICVLCGGIICPEDHKCLCEYNSVK